MMSNRCLAAIFVLAAAGCRFDEPSYDGTSFRCEPPAGRCPEGYSCRAGVCVSDGEPEVDAPPGDAEPPEVDAAPIDPDPTFGERPDADHQDVTTDTTLDFEEPDRARGAGTAVDIDASPLKNGLIRFDLSAVPPAAVVVSAQLEVTVFDPIESGSFEGYQVLESWHELSTTWNVRITGLPWTGAGVTGASRGPRIATFAPRTTGVATVAIDPAAVQTWIANPQANWGIVWISTSPDGRGGQFYAREHPTAAERPLLRLTLAP